jgi:hypothetical protein
MSAEFTNEQKNMHFKLKTGAENFQKINPLVFKPVACWLKFIGGWTMARNRGYQEDLQKALQDSEDAAAYLSAA